MRPDDRILVEIVIVVMADPGIGRLDRLEGRHAHGKPRPDLLGEPLVIDFEIELRRFVRFLRRQAGDELPALWPEIEPAGIDGQRRLVQRLRCLAAVEHEDIALARADRQRNPGHARDLAGGGLAAFTSAAVDRAAIAQHHAAHLPVVHAPRR